MSKEAVVTLANQTRTWESQQHGTFYVHAIMFDNGDSGEYSSKSQTQDKFVVGQKASYDITPVNGHPDKIKPASDFQTGGFKKADPIEIRKAVALKEAVNLAANGKIGLDRIPKYYASLYHLLASDVASFESGKKPTELPTAGTAPPPTEDNLPF